MARGRSAQARAAPARPARSRTRGVPGSGDRAATPPPPAARGRGRSEEPRRGRPLTEMAVTEHTRACSECGTSVAPAERYGSHNLHKIPCAKRCRKWDHGLRVRPQAFSLLFFIIFYLKIIFVKFQFSNLLFYLLLF